MPLISFTTITPRDRWRNVLAAIFKGSMGHHLELDVAQARNIMKNVQIFLDADAKRNITEIDRVFADLQSKGVQVVIFSLYPVDTIPPI